MTVSPAKPTGEYQVARIRVPRWLALSAGLASSILGIATNLYSAEFRRALEASGRQLDSMVVAVTLSAVVASASTTLFYRWVVRRKQHTLVNHGKIEIRADALQLVENEQDSVVGRFLHYIESNRDSDELIVFMHGLGLDANDFRPYMAESRFHCIAVTSFGFNVEEKDDEHYPPISLRAHVQLAGYTLRKLRQQYPRKRMALVGFSFGADIILLLTQYCPQVLPDLGIHKVVLLDPNVNKSTTTISSKISQVNEAQPLTQFVKLLESASNIAEFRYLCEYLYKITAKDFAQIQRHAREIVAVWDVDSNDQFLNYLGQLIKATDGVHVVLSFNFERLFNTIAHGAISRGLDSDTLECSQNDHFELIEPGFLKDRLEGLL